MDAARAFFRDMGAVRDHATRTIFLESEADKISTRLQRSVFSSELPLERKMHIRTTSTFAAKSSTCSATSIGEPIGDARPELRP